MAFNPMKYMMKLAVFLYRVSGGKIGGSVNGFPVLLLTTTGRKSGKTHTNPVAYIQQGDEYLISASYAGQPKNPAWFLNLEKTPDAKIELSGKSMNVHAEIASSDERTQLYELFKAKGSNFVEYEKKTTRKIPVIRLKPQPA